MPAFIAAAAVAAGVSTAVAAGFGTLGALSAGAFFMQAFAVSAIIGGVSRALQKNPKNPEPMVQSGSRTVTVRQPISPWEVALGRARKAGILTFRYISPNQLYWHMVVTVACHPCQGIDEVWLNDERLSLDANGHAQGKWTRTAIPEDVHAATVPGSPYAVTVPTGVTSVAAVFFDRGDGSFYRAFEVAAGAINSPFDYSRSGSTFTFHAGLSGRAVQIRTYDGTENSHIRVQISLGDEDENTQPFPDLVAESSGRWSNDHLQYGHTKVYIRMEANPDLFPFGVPNFTFVMRGANEVLDPRTGLTGYSNNAALCTNWYLTNDEFGPGFDYDEEVDEDDLITAANDADDAVTLAGGGTEPRYTVNGVFSTSEQPKAVLERLLAACAGTLVDLGDKWRINMGVYHAPTVTLTESHLAGPSIINPHLPGREDANGVKGVFTNPNAHWQPDDFPAIEGAAYLAADEGKRKWKDVDFTAFVTSSSQAQRLAKIELLKIRQPLSEESTFKLAAWAAVPGKTVARTDAQLGWTAKAFEVLDSELVIVGDDSPVLAVKQVLRETAAAIYDWSTSDEVVEDLAPNTSLPDAGVVPPPGQPVITEALVETVDARGVAVKVTMAWVASTYPFGTTYRPEYKLNADTAWTVLPLTEGLSTEIFDIAPARYDFRVLAIGRPGAASEYSTTSNVEVRGLTIAPAAPTGLSIQAGGGTARLKIDQAPDLDVLRGGRVLVRHCHEGVTPSWESSFSIGEREGYPGDATQIDLPLKPGTYLVKFRDFSGHESEEWAEIETKQASVLTFTTLSTVTFDPDFAGTHNGTAVADGELVLGGVGLIDDITDFDAVSDLDGYGGIADDGTWTASTGLDLGTVSNVRLTSRVEGAINNLLDAIDDRSGDVDDWIDWDGASFGGSAADAWLEVRETDDDPSAAPVWSEWKRLDAAEFRLRACEFRGRLKSIDPAYRPQVSVLRVTAEEIV